MNNLALYNHLVSAGITTLYHFTSRRNILSILEHGGLLSWKQLVAQSIEHVPGSNTLSRALDEERNLGDFVRLSIIPDTPMYRFVKKSGRVPDLTLIPLPVRVILEANQVLFSNTNAASKRAVIGDQPDILPASELERILHVNKNATRQGSEREGIEQAEILIRGFVAVDAKTLRRAA